MPRMAKAADDGQDASFESALSNIAHASLQSKAPGLLDYLVGFQLVDRDQDENKAVGVFGFKVGSSWLYAPVFFLNGDVRDNEILYRKNQDKCVPLTEAWVNYLLSKKPLSLGEGTGRNTREIGVHYPDMFRALQAPRKYASAGRLVTWTAEEQADVRREAAGLMGRLKAAGAASADAVAAMPDWAKIAVCTIAAAGDPRPFPSPQLPSAIADGGLKAAAVLEAAARFHPSLRRGLDEFYSPADFSTALTHAAAKTAADASRAASRRRPAVKLASVLDAGSPAASGRLAAYRLGDPTIALTVAEKAALFSRGVLIKDAREDDEVSKAYAVPTRVMFEQKFRNPDATGVYEVLAKDGSLSKCLVVFGPTDAGRTFQWCTVVRLDGGSGRRKAFLNVHPSYVWVARQYKGWKEWFESLPSAESLDVDGRYVLLGPDGSGTPPFDVRCELGADARGGRIYDVSFDTACERRRGAWGTGVNNDYPPSFDDDYSPWRDGSRVHVGASGFSTLRAVRGDLFAPGSFRRLSIKPDEAESDPDGSMVGLSFGDLGRSDGELLLGDALDVRTGIMAKTSSLRIHNDGVEVTVDGGAWKGAAVDALVHLVVGRGFREDAAEAMLAESRELGRAGKTAEYLAKYAGGYSADSDYGSQRRTLPFLTADGPNAPPLSDPLYQQDSYMGSAVPSIHSYEQLHEVTDLRPGVGNREAYNPTINQDPHPLVVAQEAAAKGQREVFDTSMLSSLLRASGDESLVDKYLRPIEDCVDALGRQLLGFNYHGDQFADRFGQDEMPEFGDALRRNFKNLGEHFLFLKMRTVDANPEESAGAVDLDDAAQS